MPVHKQPPCDPSPNADDPEQSRRFIDMAREVGVDENSDAFSRAFMKVICAPEAAKTTAEKK